MTQWLKRNGGVAAFFLLIAAWIVVVVLSAGWAWNPSGRDWDFENTGQLGDSFGIISAGMAAIAALFAFRTFQAAREDNARLAAQAAEASFLNLLQHRLDVLSRVRTTDSGWDSVTGRPTSTDHFGQKVIDSTAAELWSGRMPLTPERFHEVTGSVWGLSNLFRFTYHVVGFAVRQFAKVPADQPMTKSDPSYQYVRLLRAQMADTELLLVALNCAWGEGHEKFKPLVERYAFLHNLDPRLAWHFDLPALFAPEAFGLTPEDRAPLYAARPAEPSIVQAAEPPADDPLI